MKVLMKILNEEHEIGRCIEDFHDDSWVSEIIVIDGGSTDYTVHEVNKFDKVKCYVHPYLDWYHAMEITQANIMLTYAAEGEICFLIDADERVSLGLKEYLQTCDEKQWLPADLVQVPRRTIEVIRYENSPYCVYGEDGWPLESHQIGQWPDYQPRLIRKTYKMQWVHSPHRVLIGYDKDIQIEPGDAYILHYEKDDMRKRHSIERRWLRPDATRKKLGLKNDLYETGAKAQYEEATDPDFWKDGK
jgi:glycosyltransferase involved in cell wall biosynthesis